ncbi:transposase [Streptomyces europaeiscabiei]|uniref:transposase n=1 Tax=Streptomyces TaxID=1883 RepID=UPI0015C4F074|nr:MULTISPECIES: transposase [Streptomyces]MDX3630656.1 transposase [Streptomyces europaeiscabiei]MDX3648793.1 transposase [Streptomyces europaeiscabiei]
MESRRPLDVLPGRDADPLADWLRGHPEVQIICRDRAGAYAEGARSGAPQAQQVADVWHLWRNLAEAVDKTVGTHHPCIRAVFATPPVADDPASKPLATMVPPVESEPFDPPDGTLDVLGQPRRLVARTTERFEAVQERLAAGMSLAAIRRELRLDHSTVRRFARAQSLDELLVKAVNRTSILDPHKPYLHQRWNQGCHDIPQLHRNCASRPSPATSRACAAISAPSRNPVVPGQSTLQRRGRNRGRRPSPAELCAGS